MKSYFSLVYREAKPSFFNTHQLAKRHFVRLIASRLISVVWSMIEKTTDKVTFFHLLFLKYQDIADIDRIFRLALPCLSHYENISWRIAEFTFPSWVGEIWKNNSPSITSIVPQLPMLTLHYNKQEGKQGKLAKECYCCWW